MEEDEIAIVGAGCRFPGAENLDEYWKLLVNGENHVREIPESRWKNSAFYDEDPNAPGKTYVKKAGLLENHDKFDHRLFGISEVEASRMDPQQRYVLECVHMAMEDGGFTRKQLNGTKTGVIIGCMNDDYKAIANDDLQDVSGYNPTGTSVSVISARVSYTYNLHGTCLTLDTACSSALVAIHLASQTINTGDCDMMICGGVSSIMSPDIFVPLCKARMMSATGQCQSFCDTADGYARGEGCGIVILKSLKAAIRDGNKIWGTIKTGSNQDGSMAKPITAPSGEQQLKLLNEVYVKYKFNPSEIQYIEAHGTGTPIGDPTELNALGEFFSSSRDQSDVLLVGSVKSNIGHTESAAGIAGLLKVLLMMSHGLYVPSLHVNPDKSNVNKKIKLTENGLDICTSVNQWPLNSNNERHACLNSFGFGGSNTHAIISTNESFISKPTFAEDTPFPVCISGIDQEALKQNLVRFHDDLDEVDSINQDMSITSFKRRDIFPYRTIVFGKTKDEMQKECKIKADQLGNISMKKRHNKIFVFCGVGTTWTGMCTELMTNIKVFGEKVHEIDKYLIPLTGWSMAEKFMLESNYDDPFINHIAIFCTQVALAEVWKSFGVVPDKIIGQSVGEVAAAHAAGCLSLEEAVNVIYFRSLILSQQSEGSMSVVGNISVNYIEDICSKYENKVCIAVYSSPVACTLSGSKDDLKLFTENLKNESNNSDLLVRELRVKCAYHSPFVEGCLDEITSKVDESLSAIESKETLKKDTVPLISTVSGTFAIPEDLCTGSYWAKNIRQPVKFMQGIRAAFEDDMYNVYLEIGPRPVLRAHIGNIFENMDHVCTISSITTKKELQTLHGSVAELFETGIDVNPLGVINMDPSEITRIPRYVFDRTGEIHISNKSKNYLAGSSTSSASHMYVQTSRSESETSFKILIDEESTPFVFEHFLSDNIIIPGATYIESGFHVGSELLLAPVNRLSVGFNFVKTFSPPVGHHSELHVNVESQETSDFVRFDVTESDTILASGSVTLRQNSETIDQDIDYLKALCYKHKSKTQCYSALEQFNFKYGESLSLIQQAWLSESGKACLTEIRIPEFLSKEVLKTHFHPSAIDSILQMFGIIVGEIDESLRNDTFAIPKGVDSVVMNRPLEQFMFGYAEEVKTTMNSTHYNAILMTASGAVIAELSNFYTRVINEKSTPEEESLEFELKWPEQVLPVSDQIDLKRILLFSNNPSSQWIWSLNKVTEVIQKRFDNPILLNEELDRSTCIIYHVSSPIVDLHGNSIFEDTVKRFSYLQRLLMSSNQSADYLPLTVVTERTIPCPGREEFDYTGSELWGMIRSALHEGYFGKARLVDIDPTNMDISVFLYVISSYHQNGFEYAISGSKVFQSCLTPAKKSREQKRVIDVKPNDVLSLHSSTSNCVTNPYLLVSDNPNPEPGSVTVTIESFTIHKKSLYTPVVGDCGIHQNDKNNQVVLIEGRGKTADQDNEVVFLYPLKASTCGNIPNTCLFEVNDLPFYQSGILILINAIARVASAVENKTDIAVLKQTEEEDVGESLFKAAMRKKRCNVQFFTVKSVQNNDRLFDEDTLIIATTLSTENLRRIIDSFPRLQRIITINTFMPDHLLLWINHNFWDLSIEVISTMEIMSSRRIIEAMPLIRTCMQDIPTDCKQTDRNNFMFNLPMETCELKQDIEKESLKCYLTTMSAFRSDASYIVIGGLTGLGWELLQHMVTTGAKVLLTMSRRKPTDIMIKKLTQLETECECRVIPLQVDVCDLESVQLAFKRISQNLPSKPIRGIFHGAGITSDSILENLDYERIVKVMKPKVQGVWNLHIASLQLPLDYFVVHSSIASILGNPGQCNYAAANSFLDSFACYRRSIGLPAQSINWGALEVGMAAETDDLKLKLKEKGFNLLNKEQIREYFVQAILNDKANVIFADMEWENVLSSPTFGMQIVKYNEFQKIKFGSKILNKKIRIDFDEFNALDEEQKKEKVKGMVKEIIQLVLVTEKDSLTDDTRLTDIGIDSMAAMTLSNAIYDAFGVREQVVTFLSEETTVGTISKTLLEKFGTTSTEEDKEVEKASDNSSDFKHFFDSKDVTFMQKDVLDKCRKQIHNPYFIFVIDIEVSWCRLPLNTWRKIFIHSLKLNPGFLRRYFLLQNGELASEPSLEDDPPVNVAKISMKEFQKSQKYDVREEIKFDINGSLPIALQIADGATKAGIRLIVHRVVIDLRGLTIFCRDLGKTLEAVMKKTELPSKRADIDVPSAVRRSVLPRMKELKEYWKNYLNLDLKPLTFASHLEECDANFFRIDDIILPTATVIKIKNHVAKQGITLYEFMMSLYQIYLHFGSGSTVITACTIADMRYHVPELNNVLTRCVNYIPIVANIDESETIEDFIKHNSTKLSTVTKNGAFPSSLILQNIKSKETQENVDRHLLVMNDMTGLAGETGRQAFKFRRILHENQCHETFLYVQYNLKQDWVKLEAGYNSLICGEFGDFFACIMLSLANQATDAPTTSIQRVKENLHREMDDKHSKKQKRRLKRKSEKGSRSKQTKERKQTLKYFIGSDKEGNGPITNGHVGNQVIGSYTNDSLKNSKEKMKDTEEGSLVEIQNVLLSGEFRKQTSHGWDHNVNVRLIIDADNRPLLEWGKDRRIRSRTNKVLDINNIKKIVTRRINDLEYLMVQSNREKLVFKTPYRKQAEQWMYQIKRQLRRESVF